MRNPVIWCIAALLLGSVAAEAQEDNGRYVAGNYLVLLGRLPDAGGLDFWANEMNNGTIWSAIIDAFLSSVEFHNRYDNFVPAAVQNPQPPPYGVCPYVPPAPVSDNAKFIFYLYITALKRCPDQGGFEWWLGQLNYVLTREMVVFEWVGNPEFIAAHLSEVDPLMNSHLSEASTVIPSPGSATAYRIEFHHYDLMGSAEISEVQFMLGPVMESYAQSCTGSTLPPLPRRRLRSG